jgi:hypothetical protein
VPADSILQAESEAPFLWKQLTCSECINISHLLNVLIGKVNKQIKALYFVGQCWQNPAASIRGQYVTSSWRLSIFTFAPCMLLHLLYLKPTHALILTLTLLMWRIEWTPNSIPVYSYIQQDAMLHSLFISGNCSTYFGWYFHPSSGGHTTVSTASGIYHTVTVDDGWKYHPKYVEQFPDINKMCNVASFWIYEYIGIYLGCMDP